MLTLGQLAAIEHASEHPYQTANRVPADGRIEATENGLGGAGNTVIRGLTETGARL